MKLQSRTSYATRGGDIVHIAGPACGADLDGTAAYWSISGNHYLIDGRLIGAYVDRNPGRETRLTRFAHNHEHHGNIVRLATEEEAPRSWWNGVKV